MRTKDSEIVRDVKDKLKEIDVNTIKRLPKDLSSLLLQLRTSEKERIKKNKYRREGKKNEEPVKFITFEEKETVKVAQKKEAKKYSYLSMWIADNLLNKKV